MSLAFQMDLEGERQVSRMFQDIPSDLNKLQDVMDEIGDYILDETDKNFESRGSRFGKPWAPRARQYDHPPLEDSGDMRSEFYAEATKDQVVVGNLDSKFPFHQSNQARTSNLPRRIMLEITNPISEGIGQRIQAKMVKVLRRRSTSR